MLNSKEDNIDKKNKELEDNSLFCSFRNKLYAFIGQRNGYYNVKEDYRKMQLFPRASFSNGDDVKQAYDFFKIMDIRNFHSDPKLSYMKLISEDRRLKPYSEEDFFKIIHQYPNLDLGKNVESKTLTINGEKKYIKAMQYRLEDGALVYDLPLLNAEAIHILYEIIRRAKNNMPAANSSDPYESYEETKNSFIALESSLRVGDTESYAAAGYTFILRGVENAVAPLNAAVEELMQEIKEDYENDRGYNPSLFDMKDLGENKIAIVVRMPKVTGANSGGADM